MSYRPPDWASEGRNIHGLTMEVIKNGAVMDTLALPSVASSEAHAYTLVGRLPKPECDLVLDHGSISRRHAVLLFDSNGRMYLQDLKSTHGTFINKKRVTSDEPVSLNVGDVIAFGESSRVYVVCGPEDLMPGEYDSENLRQWRDKSEKRTKKAKEKSDTNSGVSWGFGEDAEEEDSDEEASTDTHTHEDKSKLPAYLRNLSEQQNPYESRIERSDVHKNDAKLFDQLQKKLSKMSNLQSESNKISAKRSQLSGLSEGQEHTLERNEQRIEALKGEIMQLEDQIDNRNQSRERNQKLRGSSLRKRTEESHAYDSDEDEFYDRTAANKRKLEERKQGGTKDGSKVVTMESIQHDVVQLKQQLANVEEQLANTQAPVEDSKTEDSLDAFMHEMNADVQSNQVESLTKKKQELEEALAKQNQLLEVAMPALQSVQKPQTVDVPKEKPSVTKVDEVDEKPVVKDVPKADTRTEEQESNEKDVQEVFAKDEEKGERVEEPKTMEVEPQQRKKRRVMGPSLPSSAPSHNTNELEGGEQVWVPPKDQTGDGRTKLNDKFGY